MTRSSTWPGVVEDLRRALAPKGRVQLGQFAVEGVRLLERAVNAKVVPRRVIISERLLRQHDQRLHGLLSEVERRQGEVVAVPEAVLLELGEGRNSALVFGLCPTPENYPLADLKNAALERRALVLVLVNVEEPGNVGALVRTALAAGAAGLVAVGVSDPFHPKAVRTSMGSVFKLPIARASETQAVLEAFAGLPQIGAVAEGGVEPWSVALGRGAALYMGRESDGLPPALIAGLTHRVSIPMPPGVDSFSVNAAAAALMVEAVRQRSQIAN
ncbi:MAG TPA: RNA methyltransferase [Polyangiaceae bacterium]|jgi:TrmH family RNA methyltransferase|nr:RNA methyltransferase [Polyangiaceae bacterium]